ncbi:MAG: hypothetical protein K0U72_01670 [Gammaproteobacteria bacterium]|nr:hypothetical protein [Gammaproteobacteria bacterium]
MIEAPEIDLSQLKRFTEKPFWVVEQIWGAPLLVGLNYQLHFEEVTPGAVKLTVRDAERDIVHEISMDYTAELLCATHNEIDLIFRFDENDKLAFDQDHEDNGAPSNGGSTGTGNVA